MNKVLIKASVSPVTKRLLLQQKERTGRSVSELTEFAVINMPFIPCKKGKKKGGVNI